MKASILIAVEVFAFGFTFNAAKEISSFINNINCIYEYWLFISMGVLYILLTLFALLSTFLVLIPRIDIKSEHGSKTVLFFKIIKGLDYSSFNKKIKLIRNEELFEELALQTYINSLIADLKYKHLLRATWALVIGLVIQLLLFIIMAIS